LLAGSRNSGELPEVEPRSCTTSRCDSTPPPTDVALDDPSGGLRNTPRPFLVRAAAVEKQAFSGPRVGAMLLEQPYARQLSTRQWTWVYSPQSTNQRNHGRIGGRMMVEGGSDGLRVCVVKVLTGRQKMFYTNWQWKRSHVRIPLLVDMLVWVSPQHWQQIMRKRIQMIRLPTLLTCSIVPIGESWVWQASEMELNSELHSGAPVKAPAFPTAIWCT
ncbi:hypothetical protein T02_16096, partial [Trichinella nativa]